MNERREQPHARERPPRRSWISVAFAIAVVIAGVVVFQIVVGPSLPDAPRSALAPEATLAVSTSSERRGGRDDGQEPGTATQPPDLTVRLAPIVRIPAGAPPSGGWPCIVLMHGRGSNGVSFTGFADAIMRAGIVAVVPTAPIELGSGRYEWPKEVALAERYLRAVLEAADLPSNVQSGRVMLGGFSQGAWLSIELASRKPEVYSAALAVSPVGSVSSPGRGSTRSVPLHLIVGEADQMSLPTARAAEQAWRDAGWPVTLDSHAGGHSPPEDWPVRLERAARSLLGRGR